MRALFGFPESWGQHKASVFPHTGPTSYAVLTYSPLAGGDTAKNTEAGLKAFQYATGGLSDSGNFRVDAVPTQASTNPGAAAITYRLKWTALRTATIGGQAQTAGTEAVATTDLSGETVRLCGIGLG